MALRPINSVKNIVDGTFLGVAAGTTTVVDLAVATNDYVGGVTEVPIGAKVNSIYLFFQIIPTAANNVVDAYVAKGPNTVLLTIPPPGTTGGTPNRKYIIHEEKGTPGHVAAGAPPLTFRGVLKIPKGRRRFGEDDRIKLLLRGGGIYDACVKCIYKFYQ